MELIPGKDGYVQGAKMKVSTGGKTMVWRHPVQRLYPLEVNCLEGKTGRELELNVSPDESVATDHTQPDQTTVPNDSGNDDYPKATDLKPRRAAASEALSRMAIQNMTD